MYSDKSMMQVSNPVLSPWLVKINPTLTFPCLCFCRFHIGFTQCWSMKARPMQATTGLTSMTHISVAGWSTMIFQWQSHPGRSLSGTLLEATAMLVPTVSCTSMTRSHFSQKVRMNSSPVLASLLVVILEKWLVSECWLDCLWGFWALYHITLCHQPLCVSIPKCVSLCS